MIRIVTAVPGQFRKAHQHDGGYDLIAAETITVNANSRNLISTGLKVGIPEGWVGIIKSRSGLGSKGFDIGAGVIDSGYTGEVKVCFINNTADWYEVQAGDAIAQMLIVPICRYGVERVESLENSERGANGFNSTGR